MSGLMIGAPLQHQLDRAPLIADEILRPILRHGPPHIGTRSPQSVSDAALPTLAGIH